MVLVFLVVTEYRPLGVICVDSLDLVFGIPGGVGVTTRM
jgi:hypothetical protein